MARRAICTADWPATIGRVSTPTCLPRTASCSIAAGRRVSREASRTRRRSRSFRRLAILAAVVVLPEPWRPTIRMATGGAALRSMVSASAPSISTSWSWTIFTTCWPGETDFTTSAPTARARTLSVKERTTSRATSASSRARRTSRSAALTSSSVRAPRRVRPLRIPESFSERPSNMAYPLRASLCPAVPGERTRAIGWPDRGQVSLIASSRRKVKARPRQTPVRSGPKAERARGRNALSDVDLQPPGLVGGSWGSLVRLWPRR